MKSFLVTREDGSKQTVDATGFEIEGSWLVLWNGGKRVQAERADLLARVEKLADTDQSA